MDPLTVSADQFTRLAVAMAIGVLVGVERGWRERDVAEGGRTAGLRTYSLVGLLGGVAGLVGQVLGGLAYASLCIPLSASFILFKQREQQEDEDYSVTAVVAALVVFALGTYATIGDWRLAAAAGVVTTALLALKRALHTWLRQLKWIELRSALVLLAMTFVALPLLPDRGFGPFEFFKPREIWLLTIVLAGISFLAYAATKLLGPERGLVAAGTTGALISSTAVTLQVARLARDSDRPHPYVGTALMAGSVMAARVLVLAALLAPALLSRLGGPLAAFALVSAAWGYLELRAGRPTGNDASILPSRSPFELGAVLKVALMLGSVMAIARLATAMLGPSSILAVAAVAGLADVDAVTMSAAQLAVGGFAPRLAALSILVAAGADCASKSALAFFVGGRAFGVRFAAATALSAVAAVAVAAALPW